MYISTVFTHCVGVIFLGILHEVSIDTMKVVEDAASEFTDQKDSFLAYMSSMLVGDQGMLLYMFTYTQKHLICDPCTGEGCKKI